MLDRMLISCWHNGDRLVQVKQLSLQAIESIFVCQMRLQLPELQVATNENKPGDKLIKWEDCCHAFYPPWIRNIFVSSPRLHMMTVTCIPPTDDLSVRLGRTGWKRNRKIRHSVICAPSWRPSGMERKIWFAFQHSRDSAYQEEGPDSWLEVTPKPWPSPKGKISFKVTAREATCSSAVWFPCLLWLLFPIALCSADPGYIYI